MSTGRRWRETGVCCLPFGQPRAALSEGWVTDRAGTNYQKSFW
ncbi:hypothetical protein PpBr36_00687 [Pyricularia pennisetigena]|nr:hypothetical protein PpBr36_00687 [Pyricularia pennisetigena]TLS27847.1 hypothetical protein PpBr36_00687 [Pyricularia pennisetigena]